MNAQAMMAWCLGAHCVQRTGNLGVGERTLCSTAFSDIQYLGLS